MFFTIERNGSPYPMVAPIGAAAYCVVEDEAYNSQNRIAGKTRFMVAMLYMSGKEVDALDTMARAKKIWPGFKWRFIAVSPGMQRMHDPESEGELHGWFFIDDHGVVSAEEDSVRQFLTPMNAGQIQSTVVKGKLIITSPDVTKAKEGVKANE